jgi:hypothetical protein
VLRDRWCQRTAYVEVAGGRTNVNAVFMEQHGSAAAVDAPPGEYVRGKLFIPRE